ncbi:MAG: hypothetical protein LBR44_01750 [Clostridiales Family XIII bacterium]|nr:hypothetical protein [Clostridiales Family XIII bacterium]
MGERNLLEVELEDGSFVYLEVAGAIAAADGPFVDASVASASGRVVHKTKDFFDKAVGQIKSVSAGIAKSVLDSGPGAPDEFEVSFSVKFSADAGIIITSVSSEASLSVKMKWARGKA